MGIKESAQIFCDGIKSSNEYHNLIQAKSIIERNVALKQEVIEFNKKLSSIYMSNKHPNAKKYEVERLCNHYRTLTEKKEVQDFLIASDEFNEMMYRTNQYIDTLIQNDVILK